MASMNNWLAFSLSPHEFTSQTDEQQHHHHHHHHHHQSQHSQLGFNSDEISDTDVSAECFDLTSDSTPPPPFGILEAFNRNNHSQGWNMKGMGMFMEDSSCNGQNPNQEPKLENFLGGHSFSHHEQTNSFTGDQYIFPNPLQLPADTPQETTNSRSTSSGGGSINNSSSIGLSMIKTWLRNQPPPPQEHKTDSGAGAGGGVNNGTLTSAQTLSLSMGTGSLSTGGAAAGCGGGGTAAPSSDNNKTTVVDSKSDAIETAVPRKSIDTFGQRTSIYRGVTRHRWTGRYEAHLWDNSCRREGQTRKGRQVYLGGYDKEDKAARAYDLAALKYWGTTTTTNFPISNYEKEVEDMKHMTRQEYVASLRRKSSGFSRGASIYRGVTRHHQHGRWQARIGRVAGNKDLYLGTFSTQEEAAEAYDIAAIKFRGLNAVTNFDMTRYDVKSILEGSTLPIGAAAKRLKDVEQQAEMVIDGQRTDEFNMISHFSDGISSNHHHNNGWSTVAFQQSQPFTVQYPYGQRSQNWCKQEQPDSDNSTHHHPQNFRDLHHQSQLGNTHNFFQPSVLHNLMNIDSSSSMEQSAAVYGGDSGGGYGANNGYMIPMGTVISNEGIQTPAHLPSPAVARGFENMYGSVGNLYYLSQQSPAVVKANGYDQNSWVPTAVPTVGSRGGSMGGCHGTPSFTVWNDT